MKVKIEQLNTHDDKRGLVFEPIVRESIKSQQNSHVVISRPGMIRGNHYHLYGTETISVMGPALLRFKEGNKIYDFEVPIKQVYRFVIPPNVGHAIKNLSESNNITIAFNTVPHNPKTPDVISEILMEN